MKTIYLFLITLGVSLGVWTAMAATDITPPSAVANLAASSSTPVSVTLQWTAPGDDGLSGTASFYDVRYRTAPITESNFATSTPVAGEPAPHAAGTTETFVVTGLTPTTTYWFALRTVDEEGNTSALSNNASTTTPADTIPPLVSAITVTNITTASARISWATDENATSQVNYGTTTGYGSSTASSTLATTHTIDLISLLPATLYHFVVSSMDVFGNTATSSDAVFTTLAVPAPDVTAPIISGISVTDITSASAMVRWSTNESANSLVRYGTSTAYTASASNGAMVSVHVIPLLSLAPLTTYHFAVSSADIAGNTATSSDNLFTTLATSTASTTIQARLRMDPRTLNRVQKGKKIHATVTLPRGVTFAGLETESVLLNGTVKPTDLKFRKTEWRWWGRYRRTLVMKFNSSDILPLIPTSTDQFTFTVTGKIKAGTFTGLDTVRIIPKPKPIPLPKIEERIQEKIEKAKELLEKKQEQLQERQEKMKEQLEKQQEKLKDRMEKLKERFDD
ncbi:MAG: fibronectin type III domain-containing protein [Patescibacteria group bacterium]